MTWCYIGRFVRDIDNYGCNSSPPQSVAGEYRESVDVAFGDVAFQICENGVFKEKNVRLNSAGCEPHSRSDECFLFEHPIFTLLKRHVRKRHVYRLPKVGQENYLDVFCSLSRTCINREYQRQNERIVFSRKPNTTIGMCSRRGCLPSFSSLGR